MLSVIFADLNAGKIERLAYLGYSLLLSAAMIVFVVVVIVAVAGGETIIGGDLSQAQSALIEALGIPFLLIFGALVLALMFGGMNLTAKRARDAGLPGWLTVLGIVVLSFALTNLVSEDVGSAVSGVCGLLLLLVPSGTFGRNT